MIGRYHTHAQVEFLSGRFDFDPAVLRPTTLGNVDSGKDLHTGNKRSQHPPGRAIPFDQTPIDAIANANPFFERFDVNVGRAELHRFSNHELNQAHDGSTVLIDHLVF